MWRLFFKQGRCSCSDTRFLLVRREATRHTIVLFYSVLLFKVLVNTSPSIIMTKLGIQLESSPTDANASRDSCWCLV